MTDVEKLLKIKEDFYKVAERIKVFSLSISQKFEYPIFIMSFDNIQLQFPPLILPGEMYNHATYCAAYLEILKQNKIIEDIDLFQKNYKNPNAFCCIMYLDSNKKHSLIYIPYENAKNN